MTQRAVNTTRNTVVASHVADADNPVTRFFGLMGKPPMPEGHGLLITPCSDIHSCWMRFEFDAIFIDKQGKVVDMIEKMKPWRLKFAKGARSVLELNGGVIAQSGTQVGDKLVFENA